MENNRQSATVKSYISAIKAILKEHKIVVNPDECLISSMTLACRLKNDQIKTRLPIKKGMLRLVLEEIVKYYYKRNQPYLAALYTTMMSTMYHGLLRISEVTKGTHPILAKDVHIGSNKRKFLLILRTSKTHWKNSKPQMVKITASKQNKSKSTHRSTGSKKG